MDPKQNPNSPIVIGGSVIGIRYNEGIMIVSDCTGTINSVTKFKNLSWYHKIDLNTIIVGTGDLSDFQDLIKKLESIQRESWLQFDNKVIQPREYANYISAHLYYKRNQLKPKWTSVVVSGIQTDKPPKPYFYLANVDMYGLILD